MEGENSELDFLTLLEEGKEVAQLGISISIGFANALVKKFIKGTFPENL